MEVNDLMIGDWVLVNGTPMQIQAINDIDGEIMAGDELYCLIEDRVHSEDKIEPIPLSAEILQKNGWKYNELPFIQGWEQFGLLLYAGGEGYRINCGNNVAMRIDAVHELQHALRLCGIDKTIEL